MQPATQSFIQMFSEVTDPRKRGMVKHQLQHILVMALCAAVAGCNDFEAIEEFCKTKRSFFFKLLPGAAGIPSHDTFLRVMSIMEPEQLEQCLLRWIKSLSCASKGDIISLDGKSVRGSRSISKNERASHILNAWSTTYGLCIGQMDIDGKTNEITALPTLLAAIDATGSIVTTDAMGCQKSVVSAIVGAGADYALSLKGNHGTIHDEVKTFFRDPELFTHGEYELKELTTVDGGHGRIETRRYGLCNQLDWFVDRHKWLGLKAIGMVQSTREIGSVKTCETRYYLLSIDDIGRFAQAARAHWGVENSLHWVLDIVFREDEAKHRNKYLVANFAILRKIALNLMKLDTSSKKSLNIKRQKAGWSDDYLLQLIKGAASKK